MIDHYNYIQRAETNIDPCTDLSKHKYSIEEVIAIINEVYNEVYNVTFIEGQKVGIKQAMSSSKDAYFISHIESHFEVQNAPTHKGIAICKVCGKTVDEIYQDALKGSDNKQDKSLK